MVFAVEIGLVDREGVDQMFDLMVRIGAQRGEIRLERVRAGGRHALGDAAVDVIALVVVKQHPGSSIEKLAKPPDVLLRDVDGTSAVSFRPCHS